jgi:preprotein translocase subunit SecF
MFDFIRYRKIFYAFSVIIFLAGLVGLFVWKLNFGIDFKGGSLMVIEFSKASPSNEDIMKSITEFDLGETTIQRSGDNIAMLRFKDVDEETHQKILEKIKKDLDADLKEQSFDQVGPAIGNELKKDATYATFISLIVILAFISFSFRKVSKKIKSYKYGVTAVVALFHDVIITLGIFSYLGHYEGVEIGLPFVAAFLTVLGYSVNDTIVVFDRIRENLLRGGADDLKEVCNKSLNQTIVRSLSTSLVTLVALMAVYFFGGESIKYFALALIVGITFGTYSSIFIATPLLYDWEMLKKGKKTNK